MRLTGSFQTIVTQGVSGTASSPVSCRSTSAGATLTGLSPPRLPYSLPQACPPVAGHARCPGLVRRRAAPIRSLPLVTVPDAGGQGTGTSTALLTDHYELTMLAGALRSGAAGRRSVFEVFARYLPYGRRYGVVAGAGRLLEALQRFRFGPGELEFLREAGVTDEATLGF